MNIRTTINIRSTILDILDELSDETGLSRTKIIHFLLEKAKDDRHSALNFNSAVKYQVKAASEEWHKFHISFNSGFYELCIDLRKLYKLSLSHILALAVLKYKHLLVDKKTIKKGDKYPQNSFLFIKQELKDAVIFIHTWGIPEKIPDYIWDLI